MKSEEKKPVISIVVPSFNQGQYIGETLESLVSQDYPSLEIIVMDGGSTDNTTEVIRLFEKYITYWESTADRGQTHAINKGYNRSTGEIFNWLNSDDILKPGALKEIGTIASVEKEMLMFSGISDIFNKTGHLRNSGTIIFPLPEITLGFGQVNQPAMFYRRSALESLMPLNESLNMCMDLDLWMKFLLTFGQDKIFSSDSVWAGFRQHEQSKTISTGRKFREERDKLYHTLFSQLNVSSEQKLTIRKARDYFYLWKADECCLNEDYKSAKDTLRKVSFLSLSNKEKRRYLGLKKQLIFGRKNG